MASRRFYSRTVLSKDINPNALALISNKSLLKDQGFLNNSFTSCDTKENFDVMNPATSEFIASLPRMNAQHAKEFSEASMKAWKTTPENHPTIKTPWKDTTATERSAIIMELSRLMKANKQDLATILTLEAGKPLAEAVGELTYAISFLDFFAEECKRVHGDILQAPLRNRKMMTMRQPVGPVGIITPWNFPCAMITRKVAPALAAGCTVVIKPPCETPLSALAFCALAKEAGVPEGVINCLTVDRDNVEEVGKEICVNDNLRKITFTGSTAVGRWLMREASSNIKRVSFIISCLFLLFISHSFFFIQISLELGGNAPFIVFDDANVDIAINALVASKFRNSGQVCIASNRIFVQEGIYEEFSKKLVEKVKDFKCGNGLDESSRVGPLINQRGLDKVLTHVNDCVSKGGKLLLGGKPADELNNLGGTFFQPTIIADVTKDMLPYKQEIFGPVVPLIKFKTEKEVIEMANDTE